MNKTIEKILNNCLCGCFCFFQPRQEEFNQHNRLKRCNAFHDNVKDYPVPQSPRQYKEELRKMNQIIRHKELVFPSTNE